MTFIQNQNLKAYNTFGIYEFADYFAEFSSEEELVDLLEKIPEYPIHILGGGSNILLTGRVSGTVLKNNIRGKSIAYEDEDFVHLAVGAGENWHDLVDYAVGHNWGGIENLALIPGCVGASPMQNIGAYGVEIKDVLLRVRAYHLASKTFHVFSNEECQFGYRESVFKRALKDQYVITEVIYKLTKNHEIKAEYGAIRDVLNSQGIEIPTIRDIRNAVVEIRSNKLPDPRVLGNAGSFFKNPVVPKTVLAEIQQQYPNVPFYLIDDESVKIPAGWLIETAGWKGRDFGSYGVHGKQALVLVNKTNATGKDIYQLSEDILQDIQQKFCITLEREVNIL